MNKHIFLVMFSFIISFSISSESLQSSKNINIKITSIKKIDEIKNDFFNQKDYFFIHVDDLVCDDEDNLYVCDSGWNKIFKFNSQSKYIDSFGREGQGPGEFLGNPGKFKLMISCGKDCHIYVTDQRNSRISKFNKDGSFIRQYPLSRWSFDKAQVNSKGYIYLSSANENRKNAISVYDNDFNLITSFMNYKQHFDFFVFKPDIKPKISSYRDLMRLIYHKDQLIVISNFSWKAFLFNENHKLINSFRIENETLITETKNGLRKMRKKNPDPNISIVPAPFKHIFFDKDENLCICFYNQSIKNLEIYRYKIAGEFIDVLRSKNKISPIICTDSQGKFYIVENVNDVNTIGVYIIK